MKNRIIDVHHHLLPDFYVEAVGKSLIAAPTISGRTPVWTEERAINTLNDNGIATAIVSLSTPGVVVGDEQREKLLAVRCNDFAASLKARHPGRFGAFGTLPMSSIDAAVGEIRRLYDDLGANGVCLMSNYGGRYLGDHAFTPVF